MVHFWIVVENAAYGDKKANKGGIYVTSHEYNIYVSTESRRHLGRKNFLNFHIFTCTPLSAICIVVKEVKQYIKPKIQLY